MKFEYSGSGETNWIPSVEIFCELINQHKVHLALLNDNNVCDDGRQKDTGWQKIRIVIFIICYYCLKVYYINICNNCDNLD